MELVEIAKMIVECSKRKPEVMRVLVKENPEYAKLLEIARKLVKEKR